MIRLFLLCLAISIFGLWVTLFLGFPGDPGYLLVAFGDYTFETSLFALLILSGLIGLIIGAKLLVSGGVSIARMVGISEWFIGITIVAIGTSLPEIVSSIMAARRGHAEMAIGNIFGSNIFNILMVLGITSIIHPLNIQEPIHPDLNITVGITVLLLALILLGKYFLGKISGIILLFTYFLYIALKGMGFI